MNKLSLTTLLLLTIFHYSAQDTVGTGQVPASIKNPKNELGVDMTTFIRFYLNFSSNSNVFPASDYQITYRRYYKQSNLRSAIGGSYIYAQTSSPYNGDSLKINFYNRQHTFAARVGYEFFQDLSQRWQVFYGADLTAGYAFQRNDASSFNGGYANGLESASESLGLAPLLGLRFKINKRVNLITESSYLIRYTKSTSFRYYQALNKTYPKKENGEQTSTKNLDTKYYFPLSLLLTISI